MVEGLDIGVPSLKLAELRPVPLTLASTEVNALADHSVTQFVVQHSRDPLTRSWFEEFTGDNHSTLPDVA